MKINNLKVTSKFLAIAVAASMAFAPVCSATAKTKYKEGTFIKQTIENGETTYNQYVVKEGDNLSRISEKICSHYRQEISTKYWPAIAFLNNYPRVIRPGDIIIYPNSFEQLVEMTDKLRELGWTSRYIIKNKIYKKTKKSALPRETVAALLHDIYGDAVCVDEDFIRLYLGIQGLSDEYYLTDAQTLDNNTMFALTEWIPTVEELNEYQNANKPKTK